METRIDEGERTPTPSRRDATWLIGLALIALGAALLTGRFLRTSEIFWSVSLVGSGLTFLLVFLLDRTRWWALIPGYILTLTGVFISVEPLLRGDADAIFWVAAIAVPFALIFLSSPRTRWWALIPAYIMGAVAFFLAFEPLLPGNWVAAFWTSTFAVPFLAVFAINPRRHWWALIPAYVFIVSTTFLLIERLLPGNWVGAYWTLAIATPFLAVFASNPRRHWWALIPAYIFGMVAVFLTIERLLPGDAAAAFWLNAIALPFLMVFLSDPRSRWWALIPAGILIAVGLGVWLSAVNYLLPAVLIGAGVLMLIAQLAPKREAQAETPPAYGPLADRAPDAPPPADGPAEPASGPEADHA